MLEAIPEAAPAATPLHEHGAFHDAENDRGFVVLRGLAQQGGVHHV